MFDIFVACGRGCRLTCVLRPEVLRANLLPHLGDAELSVVRGSGHLFPLEAPED